MEYEMESNRMGYYTIHIIKIKYTDSVIVHLGM